jgi:putative membrane protein (TIGR04086 family)
MTQPGLDTASGVDWRVVLRGAFVGLAVIAPVSVLGAVLDHEIAGYDDSGWRPVVYVLILLGFGAAGWYAGRAMPDSPLTHGALAGLVTFALWIPIRIFIWAVRDDNRGLISGDRAALVPGQVLTNFIIAAGVAMLGGFLAVRVAGRRDA